MIYNIEKQMLEDVTSVLRCWYRFDNKESVLKEVMSSCNNHLTQLFEESKDLE